MKPYELNIDYPLAELPINGIDLHEKAKMKSIKKNYW